MAHVVLFGDRCSALFGRPSNRAKTLREPRAFFAGTERCAPWTVEAAAAAGS
jgi:hypothetical protein